MMVSSVGRIILQQTRGSRVTRVGALATRGHYLLASVISTPASSVSSKAGTLQFRQHYVAQSSSVYDSRGFCTAAANLPAAKNLVTLQRQSCELHRDRRIFGTMKIAEDGSKSYEWMTYGEFGREVEKLRNVLSHHKIGRGDMVAIIANNRVEWAAAAYACNGLGAVIVPMYEAQNEKDWKYIINDSDSKMIIAATPNIYEKVKKYVGTVGKVESVLCLDASETEQDSYKRWMAQVAGEAVVPSQEPDEDDICVIIYTSGTTGNPKGVELTHRNLCSNLEGLKEIYEDRLEENVSMAFLPWAHVYGQTCELHSLIAVGSAMGIVPHRDYILEAMAVLQPSLIISVPALFNRIYDGIMKKVAESSPLKQKIFHAALACSRDLNHKVEFGKSVSPWLSFKHSVFEKIVFKGLREKLSPNLKFMTAGGAAVNIKVLHFFEDIGVPICEGYGLTETSPVITSSQPNWNTRRLGCVGIPLSNQDVRIIIPGTSDSAPDGVDGEVCTSGPNVMKGYRKNQEANDEVFFYIDGKRFFKTGDLGRMVDGKFLKITGRIKEQFKLENGKYVVPAVLEDQVSRAPLILQTVIYGDNRAHCIALIVPDMVELRSWAEAEGMASLSDTEVMESDKLKEKMSKDIAESSYAMKSFEKPLKWIYTLEPFSQENQLLTPKMSLRRNHVLKIYLPQIEEVFAGKAGVALKDYGIQTGGTDDA